MADREERAMAEVNVSPRPRPVADIEAIPVAEVDATSTPTVMPLRHTVPSLDTAGETSRMGERGLERYLCLRRMGWSSGSVSATIREEGRGAEVDGRPRPRPAIDFVPMPQIDAVSTSTFLPSHHTVRHPLDVAGDASRIGTG